jgi:hypothetical protein
MTGALRGSASRHGLLLSEGGGRRAGPGGVQHRAVAPAQGGGPGAPGAGGRRAGPALAVRLARARQLLLAAEGAAAPAGPNPNPGTPVCRARGRRAARHMRSHGQTCRGGARAPGRAAQPACAFQPAVRCAWAPASWDAIRQGLCDATPAHRPQGLACHLFVGSGSTVHKPRLLAARDVGAIRGQDRPHLILL